jgi:hypothetical protein
MALFMLMATPVLAKTHHKKKRPTPTATPTKSVRLEPPAINWL